MAAQQSVDVIVHSKISAVEPCHNARGDLTAGLSVVTTNQVLRSRGDRILGGFWIAPSYNSANAVFAQTYSSKEYWVSGRDGKSALEICEELAADLKKLIK